MPRTILIAGLGSIGRKHLATVCAVAPEATVVALRRSTSRPLDPPLDGVTVVSRVEDALALGLDAAIVAGPAPTHLATARPLAEAGVPLLMEKPIAAKPDGVADFLALCAAKTVVVQVGYCLRFDPALVALKQALDDGRIGRLLSVRAEVGQYLPDWRPGSDYRDGVSARAELGGGALLELSHEIDYARWLAGDPVRVSATLGHSGTLDIDPELEDSADLLMETADGVVCSVHMDMLQRPAHRSCRAVGTAGTLVWDALAHETRLFTPDAPDGAVLDTDGTGRDYLFQAQFRHFLDCVETGREPRVAGRDGLRVLEIVEAARRAALEGQGVTV